MHKIGFRGVTFGVKILAIPVWIGDMLRVPGAEMIWRAMDLVNDDEPSMGKADRTW